IRAHSQRPVVYRQHAVKAGLLVWTQQPGRGNVATSPSASARPRHPHALGQKPAAQQQNEPSVAWTYHLQRAKQQKQMPAADASPTTDPCHKRLLLACAPVHVVDGCPQRPARAAQATATAAHV
ncbi:hypothetical protein IWW38_003448, partial [Coemansia aciculifera]